MLKMSRNATDEESGHLRSQRYLLQDRATKFDMTHGENLWYRIRDGDFAKATALSEGDHNNFAPRLGFAWDPLRNGRMSVRGGFGVAYQAGIHFPLTTSQWNPPYYSFNGISTPDWGGRPGSVVLYGPQTPGQAVTATGPNPNIGAHSLKVTYRLTCIVDSAWLISWCPRGPRCV